MPEPITQELIRLGSNLRARRKTLGLTQEAVAERAGLSYKFIGEIERGQANPSYLVLLKLTEALGMELLVDLPVAHHIFNKSFPYPDHHHQPTETIAPLQQFFAQMDATQARKALRILQAAFDPAVT